MALLYCNVDWFAGAQQTASKLLTLVSTVRRTLDRLTVAHTPPKQLSPVVSSETLHSSVTFPLKNNYQQAERYACRKKGRAKTNHTCWRVALKALPYPTRVQCNLSLHPLQTCRAPRPLGRDCARPLPPGCSQTPTRPDCHEAGRL